MAVERNPAVASLRQEPEVRRKEREAIAGERLERSASNLLAEQALITAESEERT